MASATPGGAPGYDDDKQFGNNVTHFAARTSQRLRGLYRPIPGSQGKGRLRRDFWSVVLFHAFGERESTAEKERPFNSSLALVARMKRSAIRDRCPRDPGLRSAS